MSVKSVFGLFLLLLILNYMALASADAEQPEKCPGLYCGRIVDDFGNYSDCQACPRGYRADESSICRRCSESPKFYDWLYLGFMAILVPALNCFFIDFTNRIKSPWLLILYGSAFVECLASALCTLMAVEPHWELSIDSCPVDNIADWYTMFYNPSPDYVHTIHCTQEAVYPLYTIVMIYYAFCLLTMMILRPALSACLVGYRGTACIYAALYFLPILVVTHALFAGLIYYSFPYLVLVASVITNAVHFAMFTDQSVKNLVIQNVTNVRNLVIVLSHWLLHCYGIIAITQMEPPNHGLLLLLVPFPALFYLLTVKFTDPDKLEMA